MRDTFVDAEEFLEAISIFDEIHGSVGFDDIVGRFLKDERTLEDGSKDLSLIKGVSISSQIKYILVKYCLGHDLESIRDKHLGELVLRLKYLADILLAGHPQKKYIGFGDIPSRPYQFHSAYSVFSLLVCLGAERDDLQEISQVLIEQGADRFFDVVCGFYHDDRPVSDSSAFPAAFQLLDDIVVSDPNERPDIVRKYLDQWHKTVNAMEGNSMSLVLQRRSAQIRSVKQMEEMVGNNYLGCWAWEAALAVKFFHIEDASFREHVFYPYEIVHYAPPLENHDYLNGLSFSSNDNSNIEDADRPITSSDLVISKKLSAQEFSAIMEDAQDRVDLYQACLIKDQEQDSHASNAVDDSAVRYTAIWSMNQQENLFQQDELLYSIDGNQLLDSHRKMTMHELLDEKGSTERRGFTEEVQLYMHGDKQDGAYIFCSRSIDGAEFKVPPLMCLRFRKFIDNGMLAVDCIVSDESLKIAQVIEHWTWIIDNYVSATLA